MERDANTGDDQADLDILSYTVSDEELEAAGGLGVAAAPSPDIHPSTRFICC